ncbi:AGC protein kinase, variant 3 [Aphanomyces astaci]|nr:AGC protein kinase, variant 3 [Aphanomyces astaci]ETV73818.1 AGC protein kinase, variant 3 [Aphanomyces astaci]|eukprot:XP_009836752.1 AGC protein kinase, variant 3 [Aphanomyces astaci]
MDVLPGEPVYKSLWRHQRGFPEAFAKQCAAQVVVALLDLHGRGFMHRDVKTGNVLLDPATGRCHLIDFGFAKPLVRDDGTLDGRAMSFVGTHYAMAPEVYRCSHQQRDNYYTVAVDWWALGVFVFELLHGSPPWPYKCEDGELVRYAATLEQPLEFPSHSHFANPHVRDLLSVLFMCSQLLCVDPSARLTGVAVQRHPWFCDVNWEDLVVACSTAEMGLLRDIISSSTAPDSAESLTSAENALFAGF